MASSSKTAQPDFPTDWDIDQYRSEYEYEEHWQLRRRFMEVNKDKFAEERLVCLAQVFINMEFLGCSYPEETMNVVNEMSEDLAREFRDSRSNRLKRTFIAGSQAAEQRAKGRSGAQQPQKTQQPQQQHQQNQQQQQYQQRQQYRQPDSYSDGPSTSRNSQSNYRQRPHFQFDEQSDRQRPQFQSNEQTDWRKPQYQSNLQSDGQRPQYQSNQQSDRQRPYFQSNQQSDGQRPYFQSNQQSDRQRSQFQSNQQSDRQRSQFQSNQQSDRQRSQFQPNQQSDRKNTQYQSNEQSDRQRSQFQSNEQHDRNRKTDNSSQSKRNDLFSGLKYGRLVIQLIGGRNCLNLSALRCRIPYEERATSIKAIAILLNNKIIADADELTVKASKATAFQKALNYLQRECYTVKPNPLQDTIKINKKDKQIVCDVTKEPIDDVIGGKLDANNKGYKMMKMMGWSGGGLGSNMQGREDPVSYLFKNNRSGLGNSTNLDKQYFRDMLQNYINSEDLRPLQFEPTFTKDERASLHEIAASLNLKSVARGTGERRFLTITKKNIAEEKILSEVLINKNPRFCNKYLVQVPQSKEHLFPEHTQKLELD